MRKSPRCSRGTSKLLNISKATKLLAHLHSGVYRSVWALVSCTLWLASSLRAATGPWVPVPLGLFGGGVYTAGQGWGYKCSPCYIPRVILHGRWWQMLIFRWTPIAVLPPRSPPQASSAVLSIPSCVTQQPISSYRLWIAESRAGCVVTVFNIPPASHYIIQLLSKRIFSRLGFVIKIVINFFLFTKPEDLQMEASGVRAASFWKWPF